MVFYHSSGSQTKVIEKYSSLKMAGNPSIALQMYKIQYKFIAFRSFKQALHKNLDDNTSLSLTNVFAQYKFCSVFFLIFLLLNN